MELLETCLTGAWERLENGRRLLEALKRSVWHGKRLSEVLFPLYITRLRVWPRS